MATINFNAEVVKPSVSFTALPSGKYNAVISNSCCRTNRRGDGEYLLFEFLIVDGEFKGRKLWSRLNVKNPNPDVVRIAHADLSAICHSVNVLHPVDTVELHNITLELNVRRRRTPEGDIVNDIKGYSSLPRPDPILPPTAQPIIGDGMFNRMG